MRSLASALATAAAMVGMSACGGQVATVPSSEPPEVWEQAPPDKPATSEQPGGGSTAAPPVPSSGPLAANTCVSFLYGDQLTLVGIDLATGSVTPGVKVQAKHSGPPPSSLAVVGNEVLYCDENSSTGGIVRVSRTDGSTKIINRNCIAIAADATGIYVMQNFGEVDKFADIAALEGKVKPESVGKLHASRLGTSSQGVLAAWHSAGEVLRLDGALTLEGYDDWINGLSGAPGNRVIVSSPRADGSNPGLVAFDAATGKNLGVVAKVPPSSPLSFGGLACGE